MLSDALPNPYFLLTLVSVIVLFGLLVILKKRTSYSPTITWLQVFLIGAALTSIAQAGLFLTDTPAKYRLDNSLTSLYVVVLGVSFIYFGFHYVGKSAWLRAWPVMLAIWGSAIAILYIGWRTNLFINDDFSKAIMKPWGYVSQGHARFEAVPIAWIELCFLIPFIMIVRFYRRQTSKLQKKQSRLVIIGLGFSFVTGIISLGILPLFDIEIVPLTIFTNIFLGALVSYALIHYGSSSVDPSAITGDIVQTMHNPALAINESFEIIFANRAAAGFLGYKDSQLLGKSIESFVTSDVWQAFHRHTRHTATAQQKSEVFETNISRSSGEKLAVKIDSSLYFDKSGQWRGAVLVLSDIQRLHDLLEKSESLSLQLATEKKGVEAKIVQRTEQLASEQARMQASVNGLQQGFMIVDCDLKISVTNQVARKMFDGLSGENLALAAINKHFSDNFNIVAEATGVQKSHHARHFQNISFGPLFLNIYMTPVMSENEIIGCVLLFENVTEQRIMERSKDEFFSIASHELRTPLTSIKGNSSMILDFYKDKLKDKDLHEMVDDIHTSAVRLIEIVNDFLDLSRLEQGKMNFNYESVAIEKIIESVAYEMKAVLHEKNLYLKLDHLTLDELPEVWVDRNRLKQVVYNLVGNASKFTEEGGITISARLQNAKSGGKQFVKVLVTDTGRGMTPESQQLLFHKFQQASSSLLTRDTTRGTGLGLYISKMIVENMGGVISLDESIENQGTTFSFTLPLTSNEAHVCLPGDPNCIETDSVTGLTVAKPGHKKINL